MIKGRGILVFHPKIILCISKMSTFNELRGEGLVRAHPVGLNGLFSSEIGEFSQPLKEYTYTIYTKSQNLEMLGSISVDSMVFRVQG